MCFQYHAPLYPWEYITTPLTYHRIDVWMFTIRGSMVYWFVKVRFHTQVVFTFMCKYVLEHVLTHICVINIISLSTGSGLQTVDNLLLFYTIEVSYLIISRILLTSCSTRRDQVFKFWILRGSRFWKTIDCTVAFTFQSVDWIVPPRSSFTSTCCVSNKSQGSPFF